MSLHPRRTLWAGLLSLATLDPALANAADTFGLGSRSIALGGAVAANAPDSSANYYNPSALSAQQDTELSVGGVAATPILKLDGARTPVDSLRSLTFGLVVPGRLARLPVAAGIAGQVAGDRLSRIVTFTESDQRWVLFDNRPQQLYLSGNLALSLTPWLSVGAGYSFLASTSGGLSVSGRAVQPDFGSQTEFDSTLDHEVVAALSSVRYPQFALTVSPRESLSFALVYRDQGQVSLEVDSNIAGSVGIGPLDIPTRYLLESETVQSFVPRQLVFGSGFEFLSLQVNVDLSWTQWSAYQSPISATRSEIELETPPGLRLDVPPLPAATSLSRAAMSDRISVRAGVEHIISLSPGFEVPARVGLALDPSGVTSRTNPSLLDANRTIFSLGSGLHWQAPSELFPGHVRLDVHAQWMQLTAQEVQDLDSRDPLTAEGHVLGFGANLSYRFSK